MQQTGSLLPQKVGHLWRLHHVCSTYSASCHGLTNNVQTRQSLFCTSCQLDVCVVAAGVLLEQNKGTECVQPNHCLRVVTTCWQLQLCTNGTGAGVGFSVFVKWTLSCRDIPIGSEQILAFFNWWGIGIHPDYLAPIICIKKRKSRGFTKFSLRCPAGNCLLFGWGGLLGS